MISGFWLALRAAPVRIRFALDPLYTRLISGVVPEQQRLRDDYKVAINAYGKAAVADAKDNSSSAHTETALRSATLRLNCAREELERHLTEHSCAG
jgi:hypothetical protein